MTQHTPDLTAGVYRCPACAFHAVATNDGRMRALGESDLEVRQ